MALFGRKSEPQPEVRARGGCADHDMRGPVRKSLDEANRDAVEHGKRMHGNAAHRGLYIESAQ